MSDKKRPYKMKRRAALEAQTRERITESAVELHGSLGPARTSMSAVAEHAGVPRSTVYRHFPDERALFGACSAHWRAKHPRPDIARWTEVTDPDERLRTALDELYAYYRHAGDMLDKLLRDEGSVPMVAELFVTFHQFMAAVAEILMRGRRRRGKARDRTRAAIGHAISFRTWQQLTSEEGLDDGSAAELMRRLVGAAAS
ncbi:MAG: TetR/AcrR family transcriptional regulator [Solirubrobacterales bacterium]